MAAGAAARAAMAAARADAVTAKRTPTAVALARGIVGERAFDRMPILADALEEAGLSHAGLLDHLRTDRGEWTAADWALTRLLGIDQPHTAV